VRHVEAQCLGSVEIDYRLVFCRGFHRQVGRLLALEDASHVNAGLSKPIVDVRTITSQSSSKGKFTRGAGNE
jgi:hypothetical protein